ncbi:hypothetical protein QZM93_30640 [Burkholderia cepacia]|uniref:hypothetical protein n=1 Tax=Burkholderia cepacia TaxID=292 RepID=UPI002654F7C8|nr:hypothetical protein [Burkholderia cepacia]MDN7892969.1 hypothetical protein [Burkholderia cepacia]
MSTKRRFRERVEVEREVLQLINKPRFAPVELCGLTSNSIASWASAIEKNGLPRHTANGLEQTLREISERCRLNADKSRDVFEGDELVPRGTVQTCVERLRCQLEALDALDE